MAALDKEYRGLVTTILAALIVAHPSKKASLLISDAMELVDEIDEQTGTRYVDETDMEVREIEVYEELRARRGGELKAAGNSEKRKVDND